MRSFLRNIEFEIEFRAKVEFEFEFEFGFRIEFRFRIRFEFEIEIELRCFFRDFLQEIYIKLIDWLWLKKRINDWIKVINWSL